MHDVIRHLALDKVENEGFGKIYEGSTTFSLGITHRLSIMQSTDIALLNQPAARHLRAIHAFTDYIDIEKPSGPLLGLIVMSH
jgi:disease resistance protein RPM1